MACFDEAVVVDVVGEFCVLDEVEIADAEQSGVFTVSLSKIFYRESKNYLKCGIWVRGLETMKKPKTNNTNLKM